MKKLSIFLLMALCASVAMGQTVNCDECSHVMSVYMGEGGLIATTEAEEVTWVATCDGVTRSGQLMPNADGVVSMLVMGDLVCMDDDEDNKFQIGPIMDGGWYWLTMDTNSAVGGLVNDDILDNDRTEITDAGDSVKVIQGMGAVLLKETATGRLGLLPDILAVQEMDTPDPVLCGEKLRTNCRLGNGGTVIRTLRPGQDGSDTAFSNGMVYRPRAGSLTVKFDLWGNGTGHYTTAADGDAKLGQKDGTALAATFTAATEVAVGEGTALASDTVDSLGLSEVTETDSGSAGNVGSFDITPNEAYCGTAAKPKSNNITVVITASVSETEAATVTPMVATAPTSDVAATTKVTVMCPRSAANQGVDLVPENPFPVN